MSPGIQTAVHLPTTHSPSVDENVLAGYESSREHRKDVASVLGLLQREHLAGVKGLGIQEITTKQVSGNRQKF